jgi:FKBP-type peptidyl-prolyl cis-trans isomerase FkpA/FKBP-type peptidyl-prolyl cis-trans isomerase FklB
MRFSFRFQITLALFAALALIAPALPAQETGNTQELTTEDEKTLYAMGLIVSRQIGQLGLSEAELEIVGSGMVDGALGRTPKVDLQTYGPKLQEFAQGRMMAQAKVEKAESEAWVAAEAAKPGAVKTASGLVITEITAGTGASPQATDTVKVHYHGRLRDGTVFDSSVDRGEPAQFALNAVIPCWTEGVQQIKVGGKSRLVCPSAIAYGDQGRPGIPGGAALDFEVELLEIVSVEAAE